MPLTPVLRAVASALVAATYWGTADAASAQAPASSCSAAYSAALGELRAAKGDDVTNAIADLRSADPTLPGQWIYSRALFVKTQRQSRPVEQERACLEKIKIAGRVRCTKFAEPATPSEPELPTELIIAQQPSNDEMRILKAVADLVDGRGAVPDVGPNGRYSWLSQRAANDLKLYISQPAHPALCAGARELTEFYATALKPLQKRVDDVADLVKRTRALAASRVIAISAADPAVGGTPAPVIADLAKKPLIAMTADAVQWVLPLAEVETILRESSPLAALQRAKPALIKAQVDAKNAGEDDVRRERVMASGRAVRMIEAAAYTEIYAARYRKFATSIVSLPREIQAVHAKACTCSN